MAERLCGKCFTEHGPYSCPLGNGWLNRAYHEGVAAGRTEANADLAQLAALRAHPGTARILFDADCQQAAIESGQLPDEGYSQAMVMLGRLLKGDG